MAQKSNTVNFLIHDANGQPQVIKVVQNATAKQPVAQIQLSPSAMKTVFKVPGAPDANQQGTVYRSVNVSSIKSGSKLVQVPVQTIAQLQKSSVESSKNPSGQQKKVQSQGVSGVKVIQAVPSLVQSTQKQSIQATSAANSKNHISPILSHTSRKRQDSENDPAPEYTSKRRKAADKIGKGLRHFSMKVCEKVRTKGFTSYNEVADELVAEFTAGIHGSSDNQQYDQKNIRRRVYDALNVLMAMNIISKEKKEIRWLGLPTNSIQECTALQKDKHSKLERIQQKTQQLHDLILQQISFKSLVERNKMAEARGVKPSPSSAIHLPFIVVNTSDKALIDCSISNDKMEYMFNFNKKFQIYDDIDILKRMGLLLGLDKGECTEENLEKAKSMVPKSLEYYVEQLGRGVNVKVSDLLEDGSDVDVADEEEEELDEDALEGEEEDGRADEYSDDSSSDVDIN